MKKVISILLSVMMVAGLFAALIPTASALAYEKKVPTVVKREILYSENFENEDYRSLTGADLRAKLGWTVGTDTNETSTPSSVTSKIVATGTDDHAIELGHPGQGAWANTVIYQNDKLAGGDYMLEYTQKMTANVSSDGQGIGFVSNGQRQATSSSSYAKTAWQVNLKERGNWDTLAYYPGEIERLDICEDIDYDPSSATSANGAGSNGSIINKEIRVRIVIDADFGMTIYTLESGAWTMQATMMNASGVSKWASKSSSIGNQIMMRLIGGPTVQLDDIEIATIEDYDGPTASMVGMQSSYPDKDGKFDVRFVAYLTQVSDFSQIESVHFEVSYASEALTGSTSTFKTKNVYLEYAYKSLSTNLGNSTIQAVEGAYYVALHLNGCQPGVVYKVKPVITLKDSATVSGNMAVYTPTALMKNIEFMHFSFDDGYKCFDNLKNNTYDSLFDEPFFGWMKEMHDEYGAIFSVYAFNENLAAFAASANATKYQSEFQAAKDWLKIGLHSPLNDQNANFGTDKGTTYSTIEAGYEQWTKMLTSVMTVTGDKDCIDLFPRLHNFAGTENAINGMIAAGRKFAENTADETDTAADYTPVGFLASDDGRVSYYLDSTTSQWLYANDHMTDTGKNVQFITTDIRAEYFSTAPSKFTKSNMYDELVWQHTSTDYTVRASSMIIFSHENRIQDGTDGVMASMEQAARFAKDFDIEFAFPQDRTSSETEKDFATSPAPDYEPMPEPEPEPEPPVPGLPSGSNKDEGMELPEIKV